MAAVASFRTQARVGQDKADLDELLPVVARLIRAAG